MEDTGQEPAVPHILVVDDTPANQTLLCEIIKHQGYTAQAVSGGKQALQATALRTPDLVLLDITMPDMDGFEVCERMKADPALREIPVIFISARNDIAAKVRGFKVGGVDYITKPFQREEINARMATHLDLRRHRRDLQASYDRLCELEKRRDSMVHMIIHDLRSPLTVIHALLQIMGAAKGLPAGMPEDIAGALAASEKMNLMVSTVLDVSKMEAGEMVLKREACDLVAIVNSVLIEMQYLVGERKILFEPSVSPVSIVVDREIMARVFQNLIGNALKFSPRDGIIRVGMEVVDGAIWAFVADNGIGIDPKNHIRVFEKFGQAEAALSNERHSTGLGLTFCKMAVEAHGGRIGLESEPGKGTNFWIELPLTAPG